MKITATSSALRRFTIGTSYKIGQVRKKYETKRIHSSRALVCASRMASVTLLSSRGVRKGLRCDSAGWRVPYAARVNASPPVASVLPVGRRVASFSLDFSVLHSGGISPVFRVRGRRCRAARGVITGSESVAQCAHNRLYRLSGYSSRWQPPLWPLPPSPLFFSWRENPLLNLYIRERSRALRYDSDIIKTSPRA